MLHHNKVAHFYYFIFNWMILKKQHYYTVFTYSTNMYTLLSQKTSLDTTSLSTQPTQPVDLLFLLQTFWCVVMRDVSLLLTFWNKSIKCPRI